MRIAIKLAFASAALACVALPASAQGVIRTFVSGTGTDTGTCTSTSPCRTFNYAISQVAAGGEIDVLNTANYGPVVIDRSVSIIAIGVAGGINVPAGAKGIQISAGTGDIVTLRGLVVEGHGLGSNYGIVTYSAKTVIIQDCMISGHSYGIYSQSNTAYVIVKDNIITQNTYGVDIGPVHFLALGGNTIAGNGTGIYNGTVYSYKDNNLAGNTTDVDGTVTTSTEPKF